DFFTSTRAERTRIRNYLKDNICIIVFDTLSLFDGNIHNHFLQSALAESGTIIGISPASSCSMEAFDVALGCFEEKVEWIYDRYQGNLDMNCTIETHHPTAFKRWLNTVLPPFIEVPQAQPTKIERLKRNTPTEKQGVGGFLSGGEG
ncbi:MAG: hypothetical protein GY765_34635, partial [bacterium]|nr:hypothetical protein [bacterium]